jgi:hypothetical protein
MRSDAAFHASHGDCAAGESFARLKLLSIDLLTNSIAPGLFSSGDDGLTDLYFCKKINPTKTMT